MNLTVRFHSACDMAILTDLRAKPIHVLLKDTIRCPSRKRHSILPLRSRNKDQS
jgi:hypothetical protein